MIIFFHGSSGINQTSKRYINYLSRFDDVICEPFVKPKKHSCKFNLRYISNVRNIFRDEKRYMCIYDTIRKERHKHAMKLIRKFKDDNLILVGISEGAIGISRIVHPSVKRKILIGYSGEQNYFTFRKNPLRCKCPTDIFLGEYDPYFSPYSWSVASQISLKSKYFPKHTIYGQPKTVQNMTSFIKFHQVPRKKHDVFGTFIKNKLKICLL